MDNLNRRFKALVSKEKSDWLQESDWRFENKVWLDYSFEIALRILSFLKEKGMSQKELAEKMNVSAQQVSKILKGKENLTLETICKIGKVLGITLLHVPSETEDVSAYSKPLTAESGPKEILRFDVVHSAFQQAQERVSLVGEPEPNYVSSGKPISNVS